MNYLLMMSVFRFMPFWSGKAHNCLKSVIVVVTSIQYIGHLVKSVYVYQINESVIGSVLLIV